MKKLLLVLVVCFFQATELRSQWAQTNGPPGGTATCFATMDSTLFAGAAGGIYRTSTDGYKWERLIGIDAYSFLIKDKKIFAGTSYGVFHSSDNGNNWISESPGLTKSVGCLIGSGENIFAGTSFPGEVFRSTNNGASWTADTNGLTNFNILSLAIIDSNIFAGTDGRGIYRSKIDDTVWTEVNNGLSRTGFIFTATVIGNALFMGGYEGIYRTTNNGMNWDTVLKTKNYSIISFAVQGTKLFAADDEGGVYFTSNNGSTWSSEGLACPLNSSIGINERYLFVGCRDNLVWRRSLSDFEVNDVKESKNAIEYLTVFPNPARKLSLYRKLKKSKQCSLHNLRSIGKIGSQFQELKFYI
jgi:photosystem II stability/assembly factor-like uncharacterized protein